ncbi:MAG: Co2+/Mg2+ efflux protein ApaG [Rhodospirillales bacterium]|nr:Co2+/Mg2+ efflux protein ApaG [Rhodospirillales bacterium]
MFSAITRCINISVQPMYLEDESDPEQNRYIWAYHVIISNQGLETVQLLTRYWKIVNAAGQVHEVRGDGVIGEQPVLEPGQTFEYTSGTPLSTPSGFMGGSYEMENSNGERFDIEIPSFSLDSPESMGQVH